MDAIVAMTTRLGRVSEAQAGALPLEAGLEADFDSEHLQNQRICHKKSPSESEETKKNKGPAAREKSGCKLAGRSISKLCLFSNCQNPSLDLMIKLVKIEVITGQNTILTYNWS